MLGPVRVSHPQPVEPAAAPAAAPFFLPTRFEGTTAKFAFEEDEAEHVKKEERESFSSSGGQEGGLSVMGDEEDAIAFFQGKDTGGGGEGERKKKKDAGDTRIFSHGKGGGLDLRSGLQKLLHAKENESEQEQQRRYMRKSLV